MTLQIDFVADRPGETIGSFGRNWSLFPLIHFQKSLRELGISVRFIRNSKNLLSLSGKILCLDSKAFTDKQGYVNDSTQELLRHLRRQYDWIVWFDNRDSSGTTQFEVMPFIDRYAKKQLLHDRTAYTKTFYTGRVFTDYMHHEYGLEDTEPEFSRPLERISDLSKLVLSWNLAYSDYRSYYRWQRYVNYALGFKSPILHNLQVRPIDLHARFGTEYASNIISRHRQSYLKLAEKLTANDIVVTCGRISREAYKRELSKARTVLSPFGWGEICFRDFEAMQNACVLLKPSLEHIDTWPDLFRNKETYIALSWDHKLAQAQLIELFEDMETLSAIGFEGQEAFKSIWGKEGGRLFANHVLSIVSPE